jgi:hypothetical protein
VHDWRTVATAAVVNWSLGYGLEFLLGIWLFFLGALTSEKGVLPWLAIGLLQKLFCLSRLRCSGVAFVPMVGWQYCYIVYVETITPIFLIGYGPTLSLDSLTKGR